MLYWFTADPRQGAKGGFFMTQRQEQFEAMLQAVQQDYRDTVEQMERLKR